MFGGWHENRLGPSGRRASTSVRQVPEVDGAQQVQSIHSGRRNESRRRSSRQRAEFATFVGGERFAQIFERQSRVSDHDRVHVRAPWRAATHLQPHQDLLLGCQVTDSLRDNQECFIYVCLL